MINTLLHVADAALQYRRGKMTGFWGLVGIGLALLIIFNWDKITPVLDFIGIVAFIDKLGLIYDDAPEMTFLSIFIVLGIFLALIAVLIIVGLLATVAITWAMETGPGAYILIGLILLLLSPILAPFFLLWGLAKLEMKRRDWFWKKRDPEGYAEAKRLEKNRGVINHMTNANSGEKGDNLLSHEEAYDRLHRLPTHGDHYFLIGITYEREIFMLFPHPLGLKKTIKNPNSFFCERLDIKMADKNSAKKLEISVNNERWEDLRRWVKGIAIFPFEEFETYIDPSNIRELQNVFRKYSNQEKYKEFVSISQSGYFNRKDILLKELKEAETKEEFDEIVSILKTFQVPNEEVVKMMWNTTQSKNEGLA